MTNQTQKFELKDSEDIADCTLSEKGYDHSSDEAPVSLTPRPYCLSCTLRFLLPILLLLSASSILIYIFLHSNSALSFLGLSSKRLVDLKIVDSNSTSFLQKPKSTTLPGFFVVPDSMDTQVGMPSRSIESSDRQKLLLSDQRQVDRQTDTILKSHIQEEACFEMLSTCSSQRQSLPDLPMLESFHHEEEEIGDISHSITKTSASSNYRSCHLEYHDKLTENKFHIVRRASSLASTISSDTSSMNRPKSKYTGHSCSDGFCDWLKTDTLARCYRINQTIDASTKKIDYMNQTVDDFKFNAPLECNLCLPTEDTEGIEQHCSDVENREDQTMDVLFGILGAVFGTALCVTVVMQSYKWWNGHHARKPLRNRTSVSTKQNFDGVADVENNPKTKTAAMDIIMKPYASRETLLRSGVSPRVQSRKPSKALGHSRQDSTVNTLDTVPTNTQDSNQQSHNPSSALERKPRNTRYWTLPIPYGFRSRTIRWFQTGGIRKQEDHIDGKDDKLDNISPTVQQNRRESKRIPVLVPAIPGRSFTLNHLHTNSSGKWRGSSGDLTRVSESARSTSCGNKR